MGAVGMVERWGRNEEGDLDGVGEGLHRLGVPREQYEYPGPRDERRGTVWEEAFGLFQRLWGGCQGVRAAAGAGMYKNQWPANCDSVLRLVT